MSLIGWRQTGIEQNLVQNRWRRLITALAFPCRGRHFCRQDHASYAMWAWGYDG